MARILLVDDDRSIRELLALHLEERGHRVLLASSAAEGVRLAGETSPSAIVLDMRLPDGSGIDFIPELKKRATDSPVLLITAHHDMATTILAMKAGAFDYIHKPIDIETFDRALARALEAGRLAQGQEFVSAEGADLGDLVGKSAAMQKLFKDIGRVAASRATVLIQGESGTGKELIARVIHSFSAQAKNKGADVPFVAINCSALVDTLLESELFGYEKGAFTGAVSAKPGKFELAGEGSVFLDEIGELSPNLQAKLLRVLQEREVERIGGTKPIPVNARVLAATHRELPAEVAAGRFREDLYQRLRVVTLDVPPLRERPDDIPLLIDHLLARINQRLGRRLRKPPRELVEELSHRAWPGNVRELENALTRAAVLSQGDVLQPEHLAETNGDARTPQPPLSSDTPPGGVPTLEEVERAHVLRVYELAHRHKGKTCELLGISRPTLERKLKRYGVVE
ncbi:MAG: sigma-54-dependent Fis family transcriptional regulator [Deltaproteobacteria bacterium]|nr:sigma-54-dependent Fis family transcriptional regulator [Deltaproteobacteria bacterium]